jgi:hypothetical protein
MIRLIRRIRLIQCNLVIGGGDRRRFDARVTPATDAQTTSTSQFDPDSNALVGSSSSLGRNGRTACVVRGRCEVQE